MNLDLLARLCDAMGVTGFEDDVQAIVAEELARLMPDEVTTDALGSLTAVWRAPAGSDETPAPTLMLCAHLDEIGLIVSHVESAGFLRFATLGGWDERVLPGHAVDIRTREGKRLRGVLGVPPPHIQKTEEKSKPYAVDAMFIDVGARSREEVRELGIRVGDSAVPFYPFTQLAGDTVLGKALDDRAGVFMLLRVLEGLFGGEQRGGKGKGRKLGAASFSHSIAAVFSTFEEVGGRGAGAAAFAIDPQAALVLEATVAGDFPGVAEARCPTREGMGPAVTLVDRSTHCSPRVTRLLLDLAEREGLPHQVKTPIFGGTDAGRIHTTRAGIATGVLSVPCRYIHSPHATLRVSDLESTIRLADLFVRECGSLFQ